MDVGAIPLNNNMSKIKPCKRIEASLGNKFVPYRTTI